MGTAEDVLSRRPRPLCPLPHPLSAGSRLSSSRGAPADPSESRARQRGGRCGVLNLFESGRPRKAGEGGRDTGGADGHQRAPGQAEGVAGLGKKTRIFFSAAQSPPRNASRARAETEHAITRQLGAERSGTDGSRLGSPCRRRRPFHAPACGQLSGLVAFSMPRAARWRRREREPRGTAAQREPSPTRRPAPSLTRAFSY